MKPIVASRPGLAGRHEQAGHLGRIAERAKAADRDPQFSQAIRTGMID